MERLENSVQFLFHPITIEVVSMVCYSPFCREKSDAVIWEPLASVSTPKWDWRWKKQLFQTCVQSGQLLMLHALFCSDASLHFLLLANLSWYASFHVLFHEIVYIRKCDFLLMLCLFAMLCLFCQVKLSFCIYCLK